MGIRPVSEQDDDMDLVGADRANGRRERTGRADNSTLTGSQQPSLGAVPAAQVPYVSDVDHTLLGSDGMLSRCSRDTLNRLLAAGLRFTVASARSCFSLRYLLAGLDLSLPVVESNGAFVSDLATGRHHVVHALSPALLGDLWTLVRRSGHAPFLSTFDGRADRCYYGTVINAGMAWYVRDREQHRDPRLGRLGDLREGLRDQVVGLTIIGRQGPLAELRATIRDRLADAVRTYCYEKPVLAGLALAERARRRGHQGGRRRRLDPPAPGTARLPARGVRRRRQRHQPVPGRRHRPRRRQRHSRPETPRHRHPGQRRRRRSPLAGSLERDCLTTARRY